jgi:hypothetical protein
MRTHQTLKITKVAITAASQHVGCNGTAHLIGTIGTNGHGGPVTYQWVLNGTGQGELTTTSSAGGNLVRVTMAWPFHSKGTGQDIAKLDVLSPHGPEARITFPYACPR